MLASTLENAPNAISSTLPKLVEEIQRALDQAEPEYLPQAVCNALREHASVTGLLNMQQQVGSAERYTRHVLYSHPMGLYTVVALVWYPGQMTPVHAHYTWCSYIVLKGLMQEECFVWDQQKKRAVMQAQVNKRPGDAQASHAGLDSVHRLQNAGDEVSISIHVYGVNAQRVSTHVNRIVMSA